MKRRGVALLVLLLATQSACADSIRLVTGDIPPYTAKEMVNGGMLTEIVQRVFELSGHGTTIDWAPWKRGYELTRIGQYDATFPYARGPAREADFLFSDLIYGGMRSVFARAASGIDPADMASFKGRIYCVPTGFAVYPPMDAMLKDGTLKIQQSPSLMTCAKMVAAGRADFFITEAVTGNAALNKADIGDNVVQLVKPLDRAEFYLIVPKARPAAQALIVDFNKGLKSLKGRGEYESIVRRHLH